MTGWAQLALEFNVEAPSAFKPVAVVLTPCSIRRRRSSASATPARTLPRSSRKSGSGRARDLPDAAGELVTLASAGGGALFLGVDDSRTARGIPGPRQRHGTLARQRGDEQP